MAAEVQLNVTVNESAAIASLNSIWNKAQEIAKKPIVLTVDATKVEGAVESIKQVTEKLDNEIKKAGESILRATDGYTIAKEKMKETSAGVEEVTKTWKKGNETIINSTKATKKGIVETTTYIKDYEKAAKEAAEADKKRTESDESSAKKRQDIADEEAKAKKEAAEKTAQQIAQIEERAAREQLKAAEVAAQKKLQADMTVAKKQLDAAIKASEEQTKEEKKALDKQQKEAENAAKAKQKAAEDAAKKAAEEAQKEIDTAQKNVSNFLNRVAGTATMLAISTLRKQLREALNEMKAVDSELITIQKTTGATKAEMSQYEQESYKKAAELGTTASEYLASVAEFAKAGYKDLSDDMGELAIKTASVGDMSTDTATSMLLAVDAAYKYKGSLKDLTAVIDGMNEIGNNFATDMDKIAQGLGKVSGIAAQTGVGIDELSAAIGTITAVTQRSGTEAATALRALFLNIIGDTKTEIEDGATWTAGEIKGLRDAMHRYVPEIIDEADRLGKVVNPMEAIGALAKSYKEGDLNDQGLMQMVTDIGGKLRSSQLLTLIQNWEMYQDMLTTYAGSAGSAAKEYSIYLDSWEAKTKQLDATWTNFIQKTISSDFAKGTIDWVKSLVIGFGDLGTAVKIAGIAIVGINFTKIAKGIESVVTALKGGIATTSLVGAALTALSVILSHVIVSKNLEIQKTQEQSKESLDASNAANEEVKNLTNLYAKYITAAEGSDEFVKASESLRTALDKEKIDVQDLAEGYQKLIDKKSEYALGKAYEAKHDAGEALTETFYDTQKTLGGGALASSERYNGKKTRFYDWTWNEFYGYNNELYNGIWEILGNSGKSWSPNGSGQHYIVPFSDDAEGIAKFIDDVGKAYGYMSEYAAKTNQEWILSTDTFKEFKDLYEEVGEYAAKYNDAVKNIYEESALRKFNEDLNSGLIKDEETFNAYIDSIAQATNLSDEYKETLISIAREAFPEFTAAAKLASEESERPFKKACERATELLALIKQIVDGSEEPEKKTKTIGESIAAIREAKEKSDTAVEEVKVEDVNTAIEEANTELENINEQIEEATVARKSILHELCTAIKESEGNPYEDSDIVALQKTYEQAWAYVKDLKEKEKEAKEIADSIEENKDLALQREVTQSNAILNAEKASEYSKKAQEESATAQEAVKTATEALAKAKEARESADASAATEAMNTAKVASEAADKAVEEAEKAAEKALSYYTETLNYATDVNTDAALDAATEARQALTQAETSLQEARDYAKEAKAIYEDTSELEGDTKLASIATANAKAANEGAKEASELADEALASAKEAKEKSAEAVATALEARQTINKESAEKAKEEATSALTEAKASLSVLEEQESKAESLVKKARENRNKAKTKEASSLYVQTLNYYYNIQAKVREAKSLVSEMEGDSSSVDKYEKEIIRIAKYEDLVKNNKELSESTVKLAEETSKKATEAAQKSATALQNVYKAANELSAADAQSALTEIQLIQDEVDKLNESIDKQVDIVKQSRDKAYEYALEANTVEAWQNYNEVEKAYYDTQVLAYRTHQAVEQAEKDVEDAKRIAQTTREQETYYTLQQIRAGKVEKYAKEAEEAAKKTDDARAKAESARDAAKTAKENTDVEAADKAAADAKNALVEAEQSDAEAKNNLEKLDEKISEMEKNNTKASLKYNELYIEAVNDRQTAVDAVKESEEDLAAATEASAEAAKLAAETAINDAVNNLLGLQKELESAKKAIEDFKKAGGDNEHGSVFSDFADMFSTAIELSDKGLFGSKELSSALTGIFGNELMESIGFNTKTASSWLKDNAFIQAAFANGGKDYGIGASNYIKSMVDANSEMKKFVEYTENADGSLNINVKDAAGLAEQLGVSESLIWAMTDAWSIFDSGLNYSKEGMEKFVDSLSKLDGMVESDGSINMGAVAKHLFGNGYSVKDIYDVQTALQALGYTLFHMDENGERKDGGLESITKFLEGLEGLEGLESEEGTEIKITVTDGGSAEAVQEAIEGVQGAVDELVGVGEATITITDGGSASATTSAINGTASALSGLDGKTATVTVDIVTNGSMPDVSGDIPARATGVKDSEAGVALVNDERGGYNPELIVDGNRAYIAGGGYPSLVYLNKGATVYTATETRKILGGRSLNNVSIPAFANGIKVNGVPTDPSKFLEDEEEKKSGSGGGSGSSKGGSSSKTDKDKELLDMVKQYMEDLLDKAKESRDEQLKLIEEHLYYLKYGKELSEKSLELEEAKMKLMEAEQNLIDAQTERTVRYYNAETGQWEWQADKKSINQAQQDLAEAQKNLVNARYNTLEEIWEKLEKEIEKALTNKDEVSLEKLITLLSKSKAADSVDDLLELIGEIEKFINYNLGDEIDLSALSSFDKGGIASGKGFMPKATTNDEVVLDGNIASNIISPNVSKNFVEFSDALSTMFGLANERAQSVYNGNGVTNNNGGNYYINGVQIGKDMADRPLSEILSVLPIYAGR